MLAVIAVAIVVAVGGAAFALGTGPFGGGDGGAGAPSATPVPTGTVYDQSSGTTPEDQPPFSFEIDNIEQCGQTCRDVTATLYNNQEESASNVTVYTRIYAGNSTDQSDQIWSGEQQIGDMEAGSSATRTQRIELSVSEGFAVQQNDGWITVRTTVRSADTTVSFQNQRNVT